MRRWLAHFLAFVILVFLGFPSASPQTLIQQTPISWSAPTTGTVSATATIVAKPGRKITKICNTTASGGGNLWLNPDGGTATSGSGDEAGVAQSATSQGGCVIYGGQVINADNNGNIITGVCDTGTCTYTVTVGN